MNPEEFDIEDIPNMNSNELMRLVQNMADESAGQLFHNLQMNPGLMPHNHGHPVQESNMGHVHPNMYPGGAQNYPTVPSYPPPNHTPQPQTLPTHHTPVQNGVPWVEIVEQPKSRGLRFRYECEGRSAGSVPGENSTNDHRTYPTIKIHNYNGPAIIVVSCVTKENPPHCKPHPHAIVGRDCKKGVCTLRVKDTSEKIVFPQIGIQCAKKKDVEASLRLRKEINVDPYQTGFEHAQTNIDLNVVRLCFQVFLPNEQGKVTRVVPPVCSHAIHDKKSSKDLVICRVDKSSGKARGGDEVFLLCDKVNKEDIKIRFFEENEQGNMVWEDFGDFGQGDVHRQYAIVFRTPPYHNLEITKPVEVFMQLQRPSDMESSEPIPFTYMPEDPDPDRIAEKRKRKAQRFLEYWNSPNNDFRKGAGNPSVRGRLHSMLKGTRRIKKEPEAGMNQFSMDNTGAAEGASAAGAIGGADATMSHVTADNSSMGSVTVSSFSAGSLDSSVIAELSGLSSSDLSIVSTENGQLVISVSGEGSGLSVDSINLPSNMLSGELMNQIDIQQLNAYLQDQGSGNEILLGQSNPTDQLLMGNNPNQPIHIMDTDPETEAALRGLHAQI
ncbi:putative transcription factor p65 homolog isoform X2 [Physella acuta]|uniref:putative transcription factor p65 homolog isoform X2 n=1 Tax=Physella acuta TaxID=109671 RepID=UPI0027DBDE5D|nr:putative transcription factor p65 homolog isoform X2 [Physella acuta]